MNSLAWGFDRSGSKFCDFARGWSNYGDFAGAEVRSIRPETLTLLKDGTTKSAEFACAEVRSSRVRNASLEDGTNTLISLAQQIDRAGSNTAMSLEDCAKSLISLELRFDQTRPFARGWTQTRISLALRID